MPIKENLQIIKKSIEKAALACGRDPKDIVLLPVSKRKPLEALLEAHQAGETIFGENRVEEALEKLSQLPQDVEIDFIGHLQSNKANKIGGKFRMIHSVDSFKLAKKIDMASEAMGKIQQVLIEVNTSGENSKEGYTDLKVLLEDLEQIIKLKSIQVKGFMTMAPFIVERDLIRKTFFTCREWRDKAQDSFPAQDFSELSMGMSGDFVEAIEEGSTIIRVGTAIFGERNY